MSREREIIQKALRHGHPIFPLFGRIAVGKTAWFDSQDNSNFLD